MHRPPTGEGNSVRKVVISGIGALTPFGPGIENLRRGLREGRSALRQARGFNIAGLRGSVVAEVEDSWLGESPFDKDLERCLALALPAAKEALSQAGLSDPADITALALGNAAGELRALEHYVVPETWGRDKEPNLRPPASITDRLGVALDIRGKRLTFVNACIASANAIGACFDLIRTGEVETALAGGVEILTKSSLAGFDTLHALAPGLCRPFDQAREGTQLSEAAAFVVLESEEHAHSRQQQPICEICGYGMSSDAYHPTRSDPEGLGPRKAMERALADSNLNPDQIDYINAHGTATFQNDFIELLAIHHVFGERAKEIPISAIKSQLGHATGACGALECLACVLALEDQFLPPTLNLETPLPGFEDYDYVSEAGRTAELRHVLSNSFGFGGLNLTLVLARPNQG